MKVEAVDDMTVDLVLDQAWGPFPSQLGTFLSLYRRLLSPKSVEEYGNEGANAHPAGTGPFVTAIDPGVKVTTERNPDYWDDPLPYLDSITYVVMPEESTRVFALEGDEAETTAAGARIMSSAWARPAIPWSRALSNQMWYMAVNMNEPLYFKDAESGRR